MTAAPASAASIAAVAISSGVIGRCGDIVGVWIPPVGAQVMITDFCMSGTCLRQGTPAVAVAAVGEIDQGAVGLEHEPVEVVDAVLGEPGPRGVVDDATLLEGGRAHATLHALDEADVLLLEHLV